MPRLLALGSAPQAAALKQALETCGDWSVRPSRAEPEWLTHSGDITLEQRIAWRSDLKKSDLIVALPSLLWQASEAMSLVHRLRTDLYWTGRFIAVMQSSAQAARLKNTSFIGEPIDNTRFGEVPSHEVLATPVQLSELLVILSLPVRRISPRYWHFDLLRSSQAAQLDRQIKEGERCLNQGQANIATSVCRNILASLGEIDWLHVPARGEDGHALKNDVQDLLDRPVGKEQLTRNDCSAILEEARNVLFRSSFPFPEQS